MTPHELSYDQATPARMIGRKRSRPVGRPPMTTAIQLRNAMSKLGKLSQKKRKMLKAYDDDIATLKASAKGQPTREAELVRA